MGRKVRAAKASLVAAFVAAGGAAATAKAHENAQSAKAPSSAARSTSFSWGAALVRFLKLDGFPAYLKIDGFAQYYKLLSLDELSRFYNKDRSQIDGLLALYQKGGTRSGGLLEGILIGLEQYNKVGDRQTLLNFLKDDGALDAYVKFETFFRALQADAKNAFSFFAKETGIGELPAVQSEGQIG